jgi:hypothetical protein
VPCQYLEKRSSCNQNIFARHRGRRSRRCPEGGEPLIRWRRKLLQAGLIDVASRATIGEMFTCETMTVCLRAGGRARRSRARVRDRGADGDAPRRSTGRRPSSAEIAAHPGHSLGPDWPEDRTRQLPPESTPFHVGPRTFVSNGEVAGGHGADWRRSVMPVRPAATPLGRPTGCIVASSAPPDVQAIRGCRARVRSVRFRGSIRWSRRKRHGTWEDEILSCVTA